LTRIDTSLNIKGKKLQLYREIRKGLGEERSALRALKNSAGYDTDDSEVFETKQSIAEYKRAAQEALDGLRNARNSVVEEEAVCSPTEATAGTSSQNDCAKDDEYDSPYEDTDSHRLVL
jgi:hypothetical protein